MKALSATLRAKPGWHVKCTDPEIRARWKSEALASKVPHGEIPLNEDEVEYVLDELVFYTKSRDPATGIEVQRQLSFFDRH